ncbi:MAG: hypothetical protein ACRDK4_11355, partial [Solirubrobacteraceae bacterium]
LGPQLGIQTERHQLGQQHRRRQLAAAIERDGGAAARGEPPPPLSAEGVVGGVFSLIHARLLDPDPAPLSDMLGSLVAMVVLPYLGPSAARRELERPAPPIDRPRAPRSADPLRDLHMRLTYRTLRVLLAVGELCEPADTNGSSRPQPSNREVGEAAGIRDQGQISKLLARLEQLGLVRNTVDRRVKGEANAWTLTERGDAVRAVMAGTAIAPVRA